MKKMLWICVTSAVLLPARAQLFSPESLGGAFWGSLIGGIAGGDCRHGFSGEGAAIGAGVGLLAGALAGEARRYHAHDSAAYVYSAAPSVSFGYGYGGCGNSAYVYYTPNYSTVPGYYYRPARPNYTLGGTLLGAASGALIGVGTGDAGAGAAIGAAAGLVAGGLAEQAARRHEQQNLHTSTTTPTPASQSAPPAAPQSPPHQPPDWRGQITSVPGPTSTYYWTAPPPQIPDAPVVPEPPQF